MISDSFVFVVIWFILMFCFFITAVMMFTRTGNVPSLLIRRLSLAHQTPIPTLDPEAIPLEDVLPTQPPPSYIPNPQRRRSWSDHNLFIRRPIRPFP